MHNYYAVINFMPFFASRCIITLVRLKRMQRYRQNGQLFVSYIKSKGNATYTSIVDGKAKKVFTCISTGMPVNRI